MYATSRRRAGSRSSGRPPGKPPGRLWAGSVAIGVALTACTFGGSGDAPATAPPGTASPSPPVRTAATAAPGTDTLRPSPQPVRFRYAPRPLKVTYTYKDARHTLAELLFRTRAQGFVVVDGRDPDRPEIVDERYVSADAGTRFQSWSMAKSVTSAAIGIALHEGKIRSIDDPVSGYLPELRGSGFAGVSIRDLLRMSSGIRWDEAADVPKMHVGLVRGTPVPVVAARQVRGYRPGSRFEYTSVNTAVLAWLIGRVTGVPFHRYVEQRIWWPAGMESAGSVRNDAHGHSLGYCCVDATDRDFARFGLLYLNGGRAQGRQVVPAAWVGLSTRPSASFNDSYGLHWWLGRGGDFTAAGFGGQFVYVSPEHRVVIVKTTLDHPASARSQNGSQNEETLTAFRAVAAEVARTR